MLAPRFFRAVSISVRAFGQRVAGILFDLDHEPLSGCRTVRAEFNNHIADLAVFNQSSRRASPTGDVPSLLGFLLHELRGDVLEVISMLRRACGFLSLRLHPLQCGLNACLENLHLLLVGIEDRHKLPLQARQRGALTVQASGWRRWLPSHR